jgi:hypothetical protein
MARGLGIAVGISDVDRLAGEIGPRPAGSAEEQRAAEFLARRLDKLGIANAILPIRALSGISGLYAIPLVAVLLSLPLALITPPVAFLLSVVASLLGALEATSRPILSRLFRTVPSQNVVGLIPHNPPDPEGKDQEPARRVILVAHLDSPRHGWVDQPRVKTHIRALSIVMLVAVAIIPCLLGVSLLMNSTVPLLLTTGPAAIVLLGLVLIVQRDTRGTPTIGRNKNASGIATVLAIAGELRRYPPLHVETLLLFTGAAQAGSAGMTSFLAENRFNPDMTYFIILDSVGAPPICFTRAEGPVLPLESSPALVHISGDIALSNPERAIRPIVHRGAPTEQYAALIRGYQAVSIIGRPDRLQANRRRENSEEIDPEALDAAYMLAHGIVRRLDEEVSAGIGGRGPRKTAHR